MGASLQGSVQIVNADEAMQDLRGPEFCSDCHREEYRVWGETSHANAFSDEVFQDQWITQGSPDACLTCHTTGFNKTTGGYAFEGVTCEVCHGHGSTMDRNTTAALCSSCHSFSPYPVYADWLTSEHSHAGVECVDCHEFHDLTLTEESSTELCVRCHMDIGEAFIKGTHGAEGYDCADCHMVKRPGEENNGRAVTGHNFMPGAPDPDCGSCHEVILEEHDMWGAGNDNCLACHDTLYMTRLHLLNGTSVAISESSLLCNQCHHDVYYEWEMGIHAGQEGLETECTDCHSPMRPYITGNYTMPPLPRSAEPAAIEGLPVSPIYSIGTIAVLGGGVLLTLLGMRRSRSLHDE